MASLKLYFLVLSMASLLFQEVMSTTFTFQNNCAYTVWPGIISNANVPAMPNTGFQLQQGESQTFEAPEKWGGNMWARTNCLTDSSGKFSCASGDCNELQCNGVGGVPPKTLVEFTLQGDQGKDFYDVSNVDGFNVPVSISPQGVEGCESPACAADINSLCPEELQNKAPDGTIIGCKSACLAFNEDQYCCRGSYNDPNICKPTNYSKIFKDACPQAYSYAYDDSTSTFTCVGANYLITFCP